MTRNQVIEHHYRNNYKQLVNHITNRVPGKSRALAEEVVQETYARALKYYDTFNPNIKPFSTWFNRILNNACHDCIQAENGMLTHSFDEEIELEPFKVMEDVEIPLQWVALIQEEMKKQRPEIFEVLNMFFNLGMKTREIAEVSEFNHGNIRQIIRRFRIKFGDENNFNHV